ncbi:MAG: 4Fe-4S binding protein [Tannerella sp.]|nr:4Fe-4S binding protein [Tannerella sp.]
MNKLKSLRVILAMIVFIPVFIFFVDFGDKLPDSLSWLLRIQLVPAIFAGATLIIILLALLTFIFGRIYCSVICPAGILQDIINRISCIGKKKKNGKYRFHYAKPMNILRYVILGITTLFAVFGITELCLALDPYSNFGRIGASIFRPVVVWFNNLLAQALSYAGNYSLYNVTLSISTVALVSAIIVLLVFVLMVYFKGRLFCNTICPVGSLLSIISGYSLFKVTFDKSMCNQCGTCERTCKAECIDSKNMKVDMSRCVTCFNCNTSCAKGGLKYRFALGESSIKNRESSANKSREILESRRSFIAVSAVMAGSVPLVALAQGVTDQSSKKGPVTPPGSLNINRFKDLCTGCHLCVVQCPSRVLKPAGLEYGWSYMLKPYMSYKNSYCNYTCTVCSEVCPTDAIKPVTAEEKIVTQVGIARFYKELCIVNTEENDCGACSEHCPTQAVHMVPYKDTLTIPQVEPELCIGCGGCESICPVRPNRAIVVVANKEHQKVQKPKEEKVEEVKVDDFGF